MLKILAAATMIAAAGTAVTAHSATAACNVGELTLERVATGDCASRIPLPSARPAAEQADSETSATVEPKEWEFIETPDQRPGEARMVRLVGPRFLPDSGDAIDFRARSASNIDIVNAAFQRTIAYLGLDSGPATSASFAEENEAEVQEAQMVLGALRLSN